MEKSEKKALNETILLNTGGAREQKHFPLAFRGAKKMKIRWKKLLTSSLVWLTAEICFNCLGLDTIADYSEFVFDRNYVLSSEVFSLVLSS